MISLRANLDFALKLNIGSASKSKYSQEAFNYVRYNEIKTEKACLKGLFVKIIKTVFCLTRFDTIIGVSCMSP